ncbi:MAG: ABC transporter permease [Planctomycetia bacterium]|nr:ABC transporter permease [Planctomycetia bacterium]
MLGPIFLREVLTVPRSSGHFILRAAYLGGLLVIALTTWLATLGLPRPATLGETARLGPLIFVLLSYVQLALFLFFPALGCAGSVAKEKDRRTFVLLLMTDLQNTEIVLGKLFGSLLPIVVLQLAGIPLLILLMLLGGIGLDQIFQASAIMAATALAAGSLGGLIALWRDRTFQSLALTTLFIVFYLLVVRGLALIPGIDYRVVEWLEPFHALGSTHRPDFQSKGIASAYGYALVMTSFAVFLNIMGLYKLRVWNPSGEPIIQREKPQEAVDREKGLMVTEDEVRVNIHAAPGVVRSVTGNPILWREVFTRAYGRRPLLVKLAYFIVLALICYPSLAPLFSYDVKDRPIYLAAIGLLPVAVLSMLLVTAQATTAITSERDTGALDLLLVTDLSAKEFIFGKLLGIAFNTKEYLLPPIALAAIYGLYGCLATPPEGSPELAGPMNVTAMLSVIGVLLVLLAFAAILGIHVALRTPNSQIAILHALSTVFFLTVGTLICIALILINRQFEYQWGSFVFFLIAGIGGLWYVLNGERPSSALSWAAWLCPLAVLYAVMNVLVAKPGSVESADPLVPFIVVAGSFGFAIAAMLVPLVSEFDVAMGRTSGGAD